MKWNSLNVFVSRAGLLLIVSLFALAYLDVFNDYYLQPASACQCVQRSPQLYADRSDAIFIGRVIEKNAGGPLDRAYHVTFDVSKSWKGIDTNLATIHINDVQCNSPFIDYEEYLVYAYKDMFEIRMPTCSGSTSTGNEDLIERASVYLDSHYPTIHLKSGHEGVSVLAAVQILIGFVGISIGTYILLARKH